MKWCPQEVLLGGTLPAPIASWSAGLGFALQLPFQHSLDSASPCPHLFISSAPQERGQKAPESPGGRYTEGCEDVLSGTHW